MGYISVKKMRWMFVGFFLALAIPSAILSHQAHQQMRWQVIHQYQKDAERLVAQLDAQLSDAIQKEEQRSDTEYTFFVLAGTPEARFIQRSELSKFPVESPLGGVIGYFQIDENGSFSSPILPSAHVQSEVQPRLYGISRDENLLRTRLEKKVKKILLENTVVDVSAMEKGVADTAFNYAQENEQQTLNDSVVVEEDESNDVLASEESIEVTGSRIKRNELLAQEERATEKAKKDADSEKKQLNNDYFAQRLKTKKAEKIQSLDELSNSDSNSDTARRSRKESNYSPQQSLYEEKTSRPVQREQIEIKLFESEIEPFRFERLESGHFVMYRQVWRNSKRLIQGAIFSSEEFISDNIIPAFEASSLYPLASLKVGFGTESIGQYNQPNEGRYSRTRRGSGEDIANLRLSEPFSQLTLDFRLIDIPVGPAAAFVNLVTACLMLVLIVGSWMLYRLAVRQSSLVEQQQDFVSSVSHELKTPLTSIRMYGEILKQGWVTEEKRNEYYDYIYTESERLSRLISNVLQISKVNHNALDIELQPVSVNELANMMGSKLDSQVSQSDFELNISVDTQIATAEINVDTDAFVQILINLVDNSIKYAASASDKRLEVKFIADSNNQVLVSVRDYGPGIAKNQLKQVFELFYRSGSEMTREVSGTGIGLALVKQLTIAMGAKIEAVNHQTGVEFKISFKLVK
jgi:signal transduction histidine kinase